MTAVTGKIVIAIITRCLQVSQLAMGIVSAVMQSALDTVKSTCQVLRPQPAKSLAGEVVLVTGAAQGIGRQLALEFWEHGSTVLCVDIDEEGNHVTVRTINAMHRHRLEGSGATVRAGWERAHAYTCDVTDRNQVAEIAQRVLKDFGRVDILVNNAPNTAVPQARAPEVVVDVVNGNLLSHFWTLLAFLPGMMKRNHGHVVAISSAEGLINSLYEELQQDSHNIRLTCVHSYVADMTSDLPDQLYLRIPELSPEHAAREIVSAVRHNKDTVSVPHNLLFWLSVLRTLPQDARDILRDLVHVRAAQSWTQPTGPDHNEVTRNGIKT